MCRAVQLITDGALDGHTEGQLASRLGVSSRHLRRLFVAELGVTPDGLARSRRAHFARRLLDDTDLPIAESPLRPGSAACASCIGPAGISSGPRRPSCGPAGARPTGWSADGGLALRLPYQGGLDWAAPGGLPAGPGHTGVEHVDGETYRRTIVVDGDPGVLELGAGRTRIT